MDDGELLEIIFKRLTDFTNDPNSDLRFWTNGEDILCETEEDCETVADFIRCLFKDIDVHTGYYDPEEDRRNGEVDCCTGYYYIDFD